MEQPAGPPVIYFDHAAAAPVLPELGAEFSALAARAFANPEAAHRMAYHLRQEIRDAGDRLARMLFVRPPAAPETVFGDSAGALAARLSLLDWRGEAAGSVLDHPAVQAMRRRAFRRNADFAPDAEGGLRLPAPGAVRPELVTIPWVQSETGLQYDPEIWLPRLRTHFPDALLLLDMVQGAGKFAPLRTLPDLALISGHKFGAPGGAALLLLTDRARRLAEPLRALRKQDYLVGRDEPLSILLMVRALELMTARREENLARARELTEFLRGKLAEISIKGSPAVRFLFAPEAVSPYILHFLLPGYDTGVIVRMLSERNIMVAAGSACRSESGEPSAVLRGLGLSRETAYSGLRLSFGPNSTPAEAERFCAVFAATLRDY